MRTQGLTHILLKKEVAEGHFQRRQEYQQKTRVASDDNSRTGWEHKATHWNVSSMTVYRVYVHVSLEKVASPEIKIHILSSATLLRPCAIKKVASPESKSECSFSQDPVASMCHLKSCQSRVSKSGCFLPRPYGVHVSPKRLLIQF